ncbi:MAG: mercuric reductase [Dehalococcoidia bacterium]
MTRDFDLAVIGAGTAGLTVARLVAARGRRVALLERGRPGGDCLWTGCVPSKALIHAAAMAHATRRAHDFGVDATLDGVSWSRIRAHIERAQAVAGEPDTPAAIAGYGVELLSGSARFVDPHTLDIDGRRLRARFIVIATGSRPTIPPIPGLSEAGFDTNESAFAWEALPASLAIIGGGPIGVELGQAFCRLGVRVSILEAAPRILPAEEPSASAIVHRVLSGEGVTVHADVRVSRIERASPGRRIFFECGAKKHSLVTERILVATGREPNLDGLDLRTAGVQLDRRGRTVLDRKLRTSQPHIFCVGDAAGGLQFTDVAEDQGRTVANVINGRRFQSWSPSTVPRVTFTAPEVASVGLTEAAARDRWGPRVAVYDVPLAQVDRAVTAGTTEGFVRIVTRPGWNRFVPGLRSLMGDEIAGATIVAPHAGDLLAPILMAMRARLPLGFVAWNPQPYPTLALGVRQAAGIPFDQ